MSGVRWGIALVGGLLAALAATPGYAQDRSFCAERPGMGTPACTLGPGQAMVEVTVFGFDRTVDEAFEVDATTYADTLLRYGLDANTEIQLGLTGYVSAVATERPGGAKARASGVGDSYLAVRRAFSGFALEAHATLPTGHDAVSAGTWGAGLLVPIDLASPGPFQLSLTPEIGAVPNASGDGRHLLYGAVLGISGELAPGWGGGLEISAVQDDAPEGDVFGSKLAATLAYQASERLQLNAEVDVVVAGPAPRTIALIGFALRL